VVAVAVHQRVRRRQIRGSQCRGRTLPATEPIESSKAHSAESRRTVTAQHLLAL